ncbi:CopY/TcrY family copper transport repressor [Secundilactobacillus collinoides]|uniref:Negative regulator of copper transport operon, AtkY n=2 Tax=Secundilactobacillus collinoides TaxID=33960 RepID=A0A0R2BBE5_SECCO|nr:CopY/TcrY family copper transport repressor [Secundilactobacillus collinoides]KRM76455.1 negative regulator of copper transport operon, AtkY [Secundilactobacillus collinoides DSM 20515 = JCM 1123]KZL35620.1 penicillinase repressor [Secundilactobacillus collinoides]
MDETKVAEISPAEWEVMRIVWTKNGAYSRDLIDMLQDKRQWSASTVKTLLRRLVNKGMLETTREDRRFKYNATVSESTAMNTTAEQLFDNLCAMKRGTTLLDLVANTTLSQGDIAALQAKLAEKAKSAPEHIECDCLPDDCEC